MPVKWWALLESEWTLTGHFLTLAEVSSSYFPPLLLTATRPQWCALVVFSYDVIKMQRERGKEVLAFLEQSSRRCGKCHITSNWQESWKRERGQELEKRHDQDNEHFSHPQKIPPGNALPGLKTSLCVSLSGALSGTAPGRG